MINVKNVSFSYGKSTVLENISFTLNAGELCSIIGVNGSGKTTLIRLIARVLSPESGTIELDGKSSDSYTPKEYAKKLAWLPQTRDLPQINAYDLIASGRYPYLPFSGKLGNNDKKAIDNAIRMTKTELLINKDIRQLSGGERQKVYLALLLAQDTPYVLLDEPFTHLDIGTGLDVRELICDIKKSGRGVLSVCHDLAAALKDSDKLLLLDGGCVRFYGTPQEILETSCFENVFGVSCTEIKSGKEIEYIFKK